jgi:hypothetical protein
MFKWFLVQGTRFFSNTLVLFVVLHRQDNIFNRYVPLQGFLEEGYDVFHAYEMRYPENLWREYGFVVCAGHQFLRSSEASIAYLDMVLGNW